MQNKKKKNPSLEGRKKDGGTLEYVKRVDGREPKQE